MGINEIQSQTELYKQALVQEMKTLVDRFLPATELNQMLQYHLGWMDEIGNPAITYAGKQIRPLLLLLCTQVAGGNWRSALPAAAAIELIHNFSLVHDDIEDSSPLRRGRPTLWRVWDIPRAINAGDTLFALAHMALWRLSETGVASERIVEVFRVFEQTNLLLTRGQHLDMSFEHEESIEVNEYLEMIGGKTAALVAGAMEMGAIVAGLEQQEIARYSAYGFNLGLAFQIQDDILGIWGDPVETGKSAATDILARKKSLPVLFGLSESSEFAEIFREPVMDEHDVQRAVELLDQIDAYERTLAYAQSYHAQLEELRSLLCTKDVVARGFLFQLSDSLFGRSY